MLRPMRSISRAYEVPLHLSPKSSLRPDVNWT
jgi:hypothetical protein